MTLTPTQTNHPPPLQNPADDNAASALLSLIRDARRRIAKPLQLAQRKKQAELRKEDKTATQTIQPKGKNLRALLRKVTGKIKGAFALSGVFVKDALGNLTWSTLDKDIEKDTVDKYTNLFASKVPPPVPEEERRLKDYSNATTLPRWIAKALEETKLNPDYYKRLDEHATVTVADLRWALKHSSKGKAPGLTGLTTDILFNASDYTLMPLAAFMTHALRSGTLPEDWLHALVLSVPKTDSPTCILETRPIALTEVTLKLLTKIITARISAAWMDNRHLTQDQYASLPGMGVDTPLQITRCMIEEHLEERATNPHSARHIHMLYVDYSKAFDSCESWLLEAALRRMGIPETTIRFFADLDSHTQNSLKMETGKTKPFHPGRGAWQGETCSPLRFVAILQILIDHLAKQNIGWKTSTGDVIFGHAYMDDCLLVAESNEDLQKLASILSEFCAAIDLKLNASKSYYTTSDPDESLNITVFNPTTNTHEPTNRKAKTDTIRYLGVHFSLNLDWRTQRQLVEEKVNNIAQGIARSQLGYQQSVVAANLLAGGLANFHFLIADFSRDFIRSLDRKITQALKQKLGVSASTADIHLTLPCLAGPTHYVTMESIWDSIQIGEAGFV